jgi:hypothetical protein
MDHEYRYAISVAHGAERNSAARYVYEAIVGEHIGLSTADDREQNGCSQQDFAKDQAHFFSLGA